MKMGVWGYFAQRPEFVGEPSVSTHKTDKAPMIIWPFRTVWSKKNVPTSMTCPTYGLAFSASPNLSQKASCNEQTAKPLMVHHSWEGKKKKRGQKQKMKVLHCGQEGISETGDIDWRQRKSPKEKDCRARRNRGLAADYTLR